MNAHLLSFGGDRIKAQQRREEIIQAAKSCFLKNGFHQSSMDDIARMANISPALIYRHFKSKVELIQALATLAKEEGQKNFEKALDQPSLIQALETLFESDLHHGEFRKMIPIEAQIHAESFRDPEISQMLKEQITRFTQGMTALVSVAQHRGEVSSDLPAVAIAQMLVVFTQGFTSTLGILGIWDFFTDSYYSSLFRLVYTRILGIDQETQKDLINIISSNLRDETPKVSEDL